MPGALLDDAKPHQSREVEGESRNEQGGADRQEAAEEGDRLGDDEGNDGDDGDQDAPGDLALLGSGDGLVGKAVVEALVDVTADHGGVDGSGDEDDGQGDSEGDLGGDGAGRQKSGRGDAVTNKGVDESTSQGVDDDLNDTEGPDRLDVVLGALHLVHEGELADGKRVGKNDVGHGVEGLGEGEAGPGPGRPGDGGHTTLLGVARDTRGDDGNTNGDDDGREVDVSQDGKLSERRRDGEEQQDDGGNNTKDDAAGSVVGKMAEGDGTGQGVGTDEEGELEHKHDTNDLVEPATVQVGTDIGVVRDAGDLELGLTDDVAGVDGDQTETDARYGTSDHAERGKGRWDTERTEGDSLDDQDDRETLPTQLLEVVTASLELPAHGLAARSGRGLKLLLLLVVGRHDSGLLVMYD